MAGAFTLPLCNLQPATLPPCNSATLMITTHFSTYRRQYHLLRVLFLCLLLLAVVSNRSFAKDGKEGDDSASSENSGSGNSGSGSSDDDSGGSDDNSGSGSSDDNSGSGSSDDNSGSGDSDDDNSGSDHDDDEKPEDAQPTQVWHRWANIEV